MMVMYIDIHSHHDVKEEGVIQLRSYRYGKDDISAIEKLSCVGVHPWDVEDQDYREVMPKIEALKGRIIAIGEIGMDTAKKGADVVRQRIFFNMQVELAIRLKLPIVVHSVRQHSVINDTLWHNRSLLKGVVIHNFVGSQPLVDDFLRSGCYLSLSPSSLEKIKSGDIIKNIPANRLFLETDESEASIVELYQKVADIRGVSVENLKKSIQENYGRLFGAY